MIDWDPVADRYDNAYADAVSRAENRVIRRWIRQADRGGPIIDLGCGTGLVLDLLPEVTPRYLGVDVSESMLRVAKHKHPEAELLHADLIESESWWELNRRSIRAQALAGRRLTVVCLFSITEIDHPTRVLFRIADLDPERTLIIAYGPGPPTRQMLELAGRPPVWSEEGFRRAATRVGFRPVWLRGWRWLPEPRVPSLTVPLEALRRQSFHPPRYIAGLLA